MEQTRYRKHPRIYNKKNHESDERELTLSAVAAVGILAVTFIKGMFWGYMIKRKMG